MGESIRNECWSCQMWSDGFSWQHGRVAAAHLDTTRRNCARSGRVYLPWRAVNSDDGCDQDDCTSLQEGEGSAVQVDAFPRVQEHSDLDSEVSRKQPCHIFLDIRRRAVWHVGSACASHAESDKRGAPCTGGGENHVSARGSRRIASGAGNSTYTRDHI